MAKLYFYYSAMNAGKSTTLLQSSYNYRERGIDTLLFIPSIYDRDGANIISSRIGLKSEALGFDNDFDFYHDMQHRENAKDIGCVLVDEAQSLTKAQVFQLTEVIDQFNIPVLAYGLRSDYRGELFEGSKYLLALAEELIEIKTICHCGRKATMNMRINDKREKVTEGPSIEIGGNERYVPTCHKHFKAGDAGPPLLKGENS